ncbi:MAG: hypothetical protein ABIQ39_14640 [Ilumatobacteraceae bacterium]
MTGVAQYWSDLVTVALLGADRRDPPQPIPGVLADLAADDPRPSPSQRLLQQVAATSVIRRAGLMPAAAGSSTAPFAAPPVDLRPATAPQATASWRTMVSNWPVLEDEWLRAVVATGHRLAGELVAPLLARHRTDPVRRALVHVGAGPLAAWVVEHQPQLAAGGLARTSAVPAEQLATLPELTTLVELAAVLEASSDVVADAVAGGLNAGVYGVTHRGVLVNAIARVRADALPQLANALDRVDPSRPIIGLAYSLAEMARFRHRMLTELEPA